MGLGIELLKTIGLDLVVDVALELGLVALLIVVGEGLHVLSNVATEDVLAEGLGVELLGLDIEAGESVLGVGDVETTIRGTLHGTEDLGTGGGTGETDIEEDLEGTARLAVVALGSLSELVLTISLLNTDEILVQAKLLEGTAGNEETGGVGSRPVGETVGDAIALQLVGVGSSEDLVTNELSADDLANDVLVGEADDKAVLWCIVLVLGLGDELLAGEVVGLSLLSSLVLDLVAAVELLASEGMRKHEATYEK